MRIVTLIIDRDGTEYSMEEIQNRILARYEWAMSEHYKVYEDFHGVAFVKVPINAVGTLKAIYLHELMN